MPRKTRSRCTSCKRLHSGTGRCADCVRATVSIYNDPRWRDPIYGLRVRVLHEEPVCRWPGCWRPSEHADHIEAISDRPELAFRRSNVQGLCARHHAMKTRQEQQEW